MKIAGIIPARYGSSRLPGKPLLEIHGKPMVWWVYQKAMKARCLNEIWVATDDERIQKTCKAYRIPVIMTRSDHQTAAERIQEVSNWIRADYYIQINGDEPMVEPAHIKAVIPKTIQIEEEFGTNIITPISSPAQLIHTSNIKVVMDCNQHALYMSRTPIPFPFSSVSFPYYKHVGIIGYNKKMLDFYQQSRPGLLEKTEGIDTLRFLDYGKILYCIPVEKANTLSVDTEEDFLWVKNEMQKML